jgi:hypothetical protein
MLDIAQKNVKTFVNYVYGKCNRSKYLKCSFNMSAYVRSEIGYMWKKIRQGLSNGSTLVYFDTTFGYIVTNDTPQCEHIEHVLNSALISYELTEMGAVHFERNKHISAYFDNIPDKIIYNNRIIRPINWCDIE